MTNRSPKSCWALLFALLCVSSFAAEDPLHTARHMYRHDCAPCHGEAGEGNDTVRGPAIAGLPDYYMMAQMEGFRALLRGEDPEDRKAQSMHQDAEELDDATLKRLVQVIAQMEPRKGVGSVIGDRERGRHLYVKLCMECHGAYAQGDASKLSPPLHGFQDWYLVEQIEKFKAGKRKANPENLDSVKMHAMAKRLWKKRDIRDVASFIATSLDGYLEAEP